MGSRYVDGRLKIVVGWHFEVGAPILKLESSCANLVNCSVLDNHLEVENHEFDESEP